MNGFPSLEKLTAGLSKVYSKGFGNGSLSVVKRKPNAFGSTFPTEIVKCQVGNGSGSRPISFFLKYGAKKFDGVYGHRGGLPYEARVYSEILDGLGFSTPKLYGVYNDGSRAPWLVMEYMAGGMPASWSKDPEAMVRSAGWIGRFHAANEKRVRDNELKFLRRYDSDYYKGWARRTKRLFRGVHAKFPWLGPLCDEFVDRIPRLVEAPQTIIHGEYFGSNIVYQRGVSRPIDWQSTAIAAGEVDLASLTHSWVSRIVQRCEREYVRARWPDGPPGYFPETLDVARVYMNLRWLGDPALMSPLVSRGGKPKVKKSVLLAMQALINLHSVGERLDLIP